MTDTLAAILLLSGGAFSLLAGVGIARMPDLLTRMQAATKAGTLGVGLIAAAAALWYSSPEFAVRCAIVILFLFLTAPVGAHLIARAAHRTNTPLTPRTRVDHLRDHAALNPPHPPNPPSSP